MELFELTKLLRSNGIPEQTVLINGILVTITKALQLNPITLQIMTKSLLQTTVSRQVPVMISPQHAATATR